MDSLGSTGSRLENKSVPFSFFSLQYFQSGVVGRGRKWEQITILSELKTVVCPQLLWPYLSLLRISVDSKRWVPLMNVICLSVPSSLIAITFGVLDL